MTIAVLADAPTLTTGFGRTTERIAAALAAKGHDVACYGLKARSADLQDVRLPYQVWPAEQGGHWTESLAGFFRSLAPKVLLLNMDSYNAVECLDACRQAGWSGPTVSYVCFDGLPVTRSYLQAQLKCQAIWTTSATGARYLRRNGIPVVGIAPPGVDRAVFRSASDLRALRQAAGLTGATVVGVFATNTERKQIARILSAFPHVASALPELDLRLYLHCRPHGFWQLDEVAESLGIRDRVIFPSRSFDEHRGVPNSAREPEPNLGAATGSRGWPDDLTYVDRMRLCDLIVNSPHSGDIEQVILEAQATGVPLVHTDDGGVMAEGLGHGGVKLAACDVGVGRQGQGLHHVAPETIAEALVRVLSDRGLQNALRVAGLANAERYSWGALETAACGMVEPFLDTWRP